MAETDLTTADRVKQLLWGVPSFDAAADANIAALVTSASERFADQYGMPILKTTTVRQLHSGGGGAQLVPRYRPICFVSEVRIDGQGIPAASADGPDAGFFWDDRSVVLRGYRFTRGILNVALTYETGYDDVPADIADAVAEMAALAFMEGDRFGIRSKTLAEQTISYLVSASTPRAVAVLGSRGNVVPVQ